MIRGDLLKRYPHTIVYAQQARWVSDARRKNRLRAQPMRPASCTLNDPEGSRGCASRSTGAFVAPDIYFIGFDLTLDEVQGDPAPDETAEAQAQLVAGATRLVLRAAGSGRRAALRSRRQRAHRPAPTPSWDDLSWANVDLAGGQRIDLSKNLVGTSVKTREEGTTWGANASDMAYILYQEPVMVGIHGREMLKNVTAS